MPIQLRGKDGAPHRIEQPIEVEVLDNDGRLAVVIVQRPGGSVRIMTPGSRDFAVYCHSTKQIPSKVVVHEDFGG